MVDNIVWYILTVIMEITVVYGFKVLTNYKEKGKWIYILLTLIINILTVYIFNQGYKVIYTITCTTSHFILYYLIYRKSIKETFFYGLAIFLIGMIMDVLAMNDAALFKTLSLLTVKAIHTAIMVIILLAIFHIRKFQKMLRTLYEKIRKVKFPIMETVLLIVILLTMSYTIYFMIIEPNIELVKPHMCIFVVGVILLIFVYLNREFNNCAIQITNQNLIKNNEFYIKVVNDYRSLKHNIIYQLNGIKSVSNKRSQKLINDLIGQYGEKKQNVQNIEKMPVGISGIIYEKIYTYEENICIEIDNSIESNVFENLTPRKYNLLCESLGILLDNALEATTTTKDKIIYIDMRETEKIYQIKIINTFQDNLDIDQISTSQYTTKVNGHGIGLFSIIRKKQIKVKTSIVNDLFLNEIIICKKSN